ncbi:MAG: hypothetical protein EOS41_28515 [Mesorhizobium sp.]|nr:MAG: hypothetical protein EOS41_28515 [Mesorhizobium sp.]
MRKQTTPFIVEIKPSRKPKSGLQKRSIWGELDLRSDDVPRAVTPLPIQQRLRKGPVLRAPRLCETALISQPSHPIR